MIERRSSLRPSLLAQGWPNVPLAEHGPLSSAFLHRGATTSRTAALLVWGLPYGRTSKSSDLNLVLTEGRGTCSSKHALLCALARETQLPVNLVLGFFEMDEENTPGVGAVLGPQGLCSIPEAHCLLRYKGRCFDFTMPPGTRALPPKQFLHSEIIKPAQIGRYKCERHRRFLRLWLRQSPNCGLGLDQVWSIREACIDAAAERQFL